MERKIPMAPKMATKYSLRVSWLLKVRLKCFCRKSSVDRISKTLINNLHSRSKLIFFTKNTQKFETLCKYQNSIYFIIIFTNAYYSWGWAVVKWPNLSSTLFAMAKFLYGLWTFLLETFSTRPSMHEYKFVMASFFQNDEIGCTEKNLNQSYPILTDKATDYYQISYRIFYP